MTHLFATRENWFFGVRERTGCKLQLLVVLLPLR